MPDVLANHMLLSAAKTLSVKFSRHLGQKLDKLADGMDILPDDATH
jgi:hypothetical protein